MQRKEQGNEQAERKRRRVQSRSTNGCKNCKSDHQKCDERRPSCSRCREKKLTCPGYPAKTLVWSTRHEVYTGECPSPPLQKSLATGKDDAILPVSDCPMMESDSAQAAVQVEGIAQDDNSSLYASNELTWAYSRHSSPVEIQNDVAGILDTLASRFLQSSDDPDVGLESFSLESQNSDSLETIPSQHNLYPPSSPLFEYMTPSLGFPVAEYQPPKDLIALYYRVLADFTLFPSVEFMQLQRSIIASWSSNASVEYLLKSMAASYLVDDCPRMAEVGEAFRQLSLESVQANLARIGPDNTSIFVLMMLGQTASWHDPTDLGIPLFETVKKLMSQCQGHSRDSGIDEKSERALFEEALTFWEMLLFFAGQNPSSPTANEGVFVALNGGYTARQTLLDVVSTVAEVGKLIHQNRKMTGEEDPESETPNESTLIMALSARRVESRLLRGAARTAKQAEDEDGDSNRITRMMVGGYCTFGLLQLYRAFPHLLRARCALSVYQNMPLNGLPDEDAAAILENLPGSKAEEWIEYLTDNSIKLLRMLPAEGFTSRVQPLLLVAISSELWYAPSSNEANISKIFKVAEARRFIKARLCSELKIIPPQVAKYFAEIVHQTWTKSDALQKRISWIETALENSLAVMV